MATKYDKIKQTLVALREEFVPRSEISAGIVAIDAVPRVVGFCPYCIRSTGAALFDQGGSHWHYCSECGELAWWFTRTALEDPAAEASQVCLGLAIRSA